MNFADKLSQSIKRSGSVLVAGFDPRLESFPTVYLEEAFNAHATTEDSVYHALTAFYRDVLSAISDNIAAVKPNAAFFEALGIGGLRALLSVHDMLRECGVPIIADAKRGDIGSTAQAYSAAFLGKSRIADRPIHTFDADALTINPFLGFDTVESFFDDCRNFGKGLFVLVKTSNPGSAELQSGRLASGDSISEKIARWLDKVGSEFVGSCGYSSLGAVVGATYPDEARALRDLMPKNYFLIPGLGSQGGTANDAVAGFSEDKGAAIINVSRGLLSSFSSLDISKEEMSVELQGKLLEFNASVSEALAA